MDRIQGGVLRKVVSIAVLLLSSGCGLNLTLTATPSSPQVGQSVTFNLSVENPSVCPIGGAQTYVVPFVPLSEFDFDAEAPDINNELIQFFDAVCTGGTADLPSVGVICRIEGTVIICEIDTAVEAPIMEVVSRSVATTPAGDITCSRTGARVTCRIPQPQLGSAAQSAQASVFAPTMVCDTSSLPFIAFCESPLIGPGATSEGSFAAVASEGGVVRSLAISVPDTSGVCRDLQAGNSVPCSGSGGCTGGADTCHNRICVGGTDAGRGCEFASDCAGSGECTDCFQDSSEGVSLGVACNQIVVGAAAAPVVGAWGLGAVGLALGMLGSLMRWRRR